MSSLPLLLTANNTEVNGLNFFVTEVAYIFTGIGLFGILNLCSFVLCYLTNL